MKCFYLLAAFLCTIALSANAQTINTIAGGFNGDGATATAIGINPISQVIYAAGNIFMADPDHHIVRKLSTSGIYTTIAGTGTYGYSGDGGPATSAQLKNPFYIIMDSSGNTFIADSYDNRIRKVDANGIITTIAGNGTNGFSGDGGAAINAQLNGPNGLAIDALGNIFISDVSNNRIRKIATNGIITTVAGNGIHGFSGDGGSALAAQITPVGVAVDAIGNLFISDFGSSRIRKITANGVINTVAGGGDVSNIGDGGQATAASLGIIFGGVAIDASGNIFIPDGFNNLIRKVAANGIITTVAGNGGGDFSGDGGPAIYAQIKQPTGVSIDAAGNIFISSTYRVRKVTTNGIINTVAGNGTGGFYGDGGAATAAELYFPDDVVIDASGSLIIADLIDSRIRKVSTNGIITTFAGNGTGGFSGDGGPATSAQITPAGLVIDNAGNILIAGGSNRIRKIDANGIITTIAGTGTFGYSGDGGPATSAEFSFPTALAIDATGNIFIADRNNNCIRKITTDGIITTVAGNGTAGFSGDGGTATAAQLSLPLGVAVDAAGNIFISDAANNRIRKMATNGIITTVAGNGTAGFSGDGGNAIAAQINFPLKLITDLSGNIIFSDQNNNRIRKVTPAGIISTIAGGGNDGGEGVVSTAAGLYAPSAVRIDASGNLFVVDNGNHRIRKVTASVLPLTMLQFTARQRNDNIACLWQTTHEVNTASFAVQRSIDGTVFNTVAIVPAAGDNNNIHNYTYNDPNADQLSVTTLFYRLEMADKDGRKTYSSIQKIEFARQVSAMQIMPNPAHNLVVIKGSNIKQISIADNSGKVLIQKVANSRQTVIDISKLPKGIYIVKAYNSSGNMTSEKLVVQ